MQFYLLVSSFLPNYIHFVFQISLLSWVSANFLINQDIGSIFVCLFQTLYLHMCIVTQWLGCNFIPIICLICKASIILKNMKISTIQNNLLYGVIHRPRVICWQYRWWSNWRHYFPSPPVGHGHCHCCCHIGDEEQRQKKSVVHCTCN